MTERERELEALLSECSGTFLALALTAGLGPAATARVLDLRNQITAALTPQDRGGA